MASYYFSLSLPLSFFLVGVYTTEEETGNGGNKSFRGKKKKRERDEIGAVEMGKRERSIFIFFFGKTFNRFCFISLFFFGVGGLVCFFISSTDS